MKKIQVLKIHGGNTFKSDKNYLHYLRTKKISTDKKTYWSPEYLEKALGKNFKVISPRMPLQDNAKYRDWAILFKRYLPLLSGKFILIGSSLGGVFLAKYLSENKLSKKTLSVYIVCPPFDNTLPGEDLVGGFTLKNDLSLIEKNCKNVYLLFSENDDVVPVAHADKYRKKLKNARIIIYKNKNGHFNVPKFPEIVKLIKADI
jgi:predicted alpha/beta hydrolase family esterase